MHDLAEFLCDVLKVEEFAWAEFPHQVALHVGYSAHGATSWRAWQDASDPSRILEQSVLASWEDHLCQYERMTRRDQDRLDRIRELTDPAHPVAVTHWLTVTLRKPTS